MDSALSREVEGLHPRTSKSRCLKSKIPLPLRLTSILRRHELQMSCCSARCQFDDTDIQEVTETRDRVLMKKFVDYWQSLVFGSSRLQKAKTWHRRVLLQQAFAHWMYVWWASRKEWKLVIKADCHLRYQLWTKVWHGWRRYCDWCKTSTFLVGKACSHANVILVKRTFMQWITYSKICKTVTALCETARGICVNNLLKKMFKRWEAAKCLTKERSAHTVSAVCFQSKHLLNLAWKQWFRQFHKTMSTIKRVKDALQLADQNLTRQVWHHWILYVRRRRSRHRQDTVALQFQESCLLLDQWYLWKCKKHEIQCQRRLQQRMVQLACTICQQSALQRWKQYVTLCQSATESKNNAARLCNKSLMKVGWKCLVHNVQRQLLERSHYHMAVRLHKHLCLQLVWTAWAQQCEKREEMKSLSCTLVARKHWKNQLSRKCVFMWKKYAVFRKKRAFQVASAYQICLLRTLARYFGAWRSYLVVQSLKEEHIEISVDFRRRSTLAKCFYSWITATRLVEDIQVLERMALLQQEFVVKRWSLSVWRKNTAVHIANAKLLVLSERFHIRKVMHSVFHLWQHFIQEKLCRKAVQLAVVECKEKRLLIQVWVAWKMYLRVQRKKADEIKHFVEHYTRVVKQKAFSELKKNRRQVAQKLVKWRLAEDLNSHHCQRSAFKCWNTNVRFLVYLKNMTVAAERRHKQSILLKTWRVWAATGAVNRKLAFYAECQLNRALGRMRIVVLRHTFVAWRRKYRNWLAIRKSSCLAKRVLLKRVLLSWLLWRQLCNHGKLLLLRATNFRHQSLGAHWFGVWKHQHEGNRKRHYREMNALWFWSQQMKRKVMCTWLNYSVIQQHIAERTNCAVSLRHCNLVRTSVICWMEFSLARQAETKSVSLQRQIQAACSAVVCADYYAQRWQRFTRSKVAARQDCLRIPVEAELHMTDIAPKVQPKMRRPPRCLSDCICKQRQTSGSVTAQRKWALSVASDHDGIDFIGLRSHGSVGTVPGCVGFDRTPASSECDQNSVSTLLQLKRDFERYHEDSKRMRNLFDLTEDLGAPESDTDREHGHLNKTGREMLTIRSMQEKKWPIVMQMADLVARLENVVVLKM